MLKLNYFYIYKSNYPITLLSFSKRTLDLFKFVYAIYLLTTSIVLINLLIAMMSDTYQRIQVNITYKS
jgi:hypothetical protein